MKGYYVYLTQDGITHVRWFREQAKAEAHWREVYKQTDTEAHIRGDMTYNAVVTVK